jgi:hypothetical protein
VDEIPARSPPALSVKIWHWGHIAKFMVLRKEVCGQLARIDAAALEARSLREGVTLKLRLPLLDQVGIAGAGAWVDQVLDWAALAPTQCISLSLWITGRESCSIGR